MSKLKLFSIFMIFMALASVVASEEINLPEPFENYVQKSS